MPNSQNDQPVDGLTVDLREYIERCINHERELRIESFLARDENLRRQAIEYSRRLDELNGHLKRTTDDRGIFFTKEAHEAFAQEFRRFRDETREHETTVRTWGSAGLIGVALLQFAIQFVVHFIGK